MTTHMSQSFLQHFLRFSWEKSQVLFSKILKNKWYHAKVLLNRFHSHHRISSTDSKVRTTLHVSIIVILGVNEWVKEWAFVERKSTSIINITNVIINSFKFRTQCLHI